MEIFKDKWFWVTTTIVFIAMLCEFYNCIIYNYPLWIKSQINLINKPDSKVAPLEMGNYGDMYGALNTLFSGLAFLGLLATIGLQLWLHYREQESKKEEKRDKATNKLVYLDFLVKQSLSEIIVFKDGITEVIEHNSLMEKKATSLNCTDSIEYNKINHIVNEIDQEVFFTAYYQKYNKKTDLINLFESYYNVFKSWQLFIKEIGKKEVEYNNEVLNLQNAYDILMQKIKKKSPPISYETKSDPLIFWNISKDATWESIEKRGNPIEIYCKTKKDYESDVESDAWRKAHEIDTYLEDCSEYFDKLESVNEAILRLCNSQLTKLTAFEEKVKEVAIVVPLPI